MQLSAASFFSKTISQVTDGVGDSTMQLRILPRSRMAILTSSAVVPGAKFAACTTNGPAEPLIEKPAGDRDDAPRMLSPSPPPPLLLFLSPIGGVFIEAEMGGKVAMEVFEVP